MRYDYTFAIHISRKCKLDKYLLMLFDQLNFFFVMEMNEDEFANFRYNLELQGIELHEITRVPHFEDEVVI